MRKWWADPVLWLMAGSGVLVLLLSGFWLFSAYEEAKENLQRETSFIFGNTIRSYEDSLSQHTLLAHLESDSLRSNVKIRVAGDTSMESSTNVLSIFRHRMDDEVKPRPNQNLRRRNIRSGGRAFFGSLSMHLKIQDGKDFVDAVSDSLPHPQTFSILNHILLPIFHKEAYPFKYILKQTKVNMDSLKANPHLAQANNDNHLVTRSYVDFSTGQEYFMELRSFRSFLLKQIGPQIFFSLLLLVVTFLAFTLSYYSLTKQRKLTILKNDLISNITHELKTPIATVKVALEAIQNFNLGADPTKRKEYLTIAEAEIDRLALLVDNVLKTSVQEGKEMSLQLEKINLSKLVEGILKTMQLQFDETAASVSYNSPNRPFWIQGDKMHLTSVIYNLIDNAIKYSPQKPEIEVSLVEASDEYRLSISDRGIGINKDHLSKIFDKFYRIPKSNIHDVKGYGLGLNYVAQVIEKHAGHVDVKSIEGAGSTFTIAVPQSL